jgi:hypothetical protein
MVLPDLTPVIRSETSSSRRRQEQDERDDARAFQTSLLLILFEALVFLFMGLLFYYFRG